MFYRCVHYFIGQAHACCLCKSCLSKTEFKRLVLRRNIWCEAVLKPLPWDVVKCEFTLNSPPQHNCAFTFLDLKRKMTINPPGNISYTIKRGRSKTRLCSSLWVWAHMDPVIYPLSYCDILSWVLYYQAATKEKIFFVKDSGVAWGLGNWRWRREEEQLLPPGHGASLQTPVKPCRGYQLSALGCGLDKLTGWVP